MISTEPVNRIRELVRLAPRIRRTMRREHPPVSQPDPDHEIPRGLLRQPTDDRTLETAEHPTRRDPTQGHLLRDLTAVNNGTGTLDRIPVEPAPR